MARLTTKTRLLGAAIAATAGISMNASAQLEEVIVTAQKREEGLQDTAIAITAISGSMMDDLNISNSGDYEALVPSLSVRDSPARLFLRGIGRVTNTLGTEPGVAVYTDQVYSSEINVLNRATSLTTERVEILRGPQGTLFGRNATGGAINVTTKRPTDDFEHHVRAKVGNYDQINIGASSSGPITEDLRYLVSGYTNQRDGYIENISGNDLFDEKAFGVGVQFDWDVSDTFNVWFAYNKNEFDNIGSGLRRQGILITPYLDTITQDGFFVSEQAGWDKSNPTVEDPYKVDYNDELELEGENNNNYKVHLTWDLANVTMKYIGYYGENDWTATGGDFGYTSNPDIRGTESAGQYQDTNSHELQILSMTDSPLQWVVGLYYFNEDKEAPYTINTPTAFPIENVVPTDPDKIFDLNELVANPDFLQVDNFSTLETESAAIYVDGNYAFNESWKLTAGIRYTEDEKTGFESSGVNGDPRAQFGVAPPFSDYQVLKPLWDANGFPENCCGYIIDDNETNRRELKDDWSNVSGRVVLDWTPTDDTLLYASISNGYKAGGFNLGQLQPEPSFDEETLISYELGYKGTFAEVLRINAAAYFYDYSDMQVQTPYLNEQNLPQDQLVNAGESEVKGIEIEATWLATDNLTLMGNYSYTDGEYTDFCCHVDTVGDPEGVEQDLSGNKLTQTPENKVYLNAAYSWMTDAAGEFVFSGSYAWVDERQYDPFNTAATLADSYYRVDAMATWFSPQQNMRVIFSAKNITEEETWVSLARLNSFGGVNGAPLAPRTYSMEVQFDF
jgi:iron complex outermembrane receptor protein